MSDYKPKPIPRLSQKDLDRFWSKVIKGGSDECWPWFAGASGDGYGTFWIGPESFKAHRISYFIANRVDLGKFLGRHTCDHKWCVNPAHCIPGTHKENSADAIARDRRPRGVGIHTAVLTEELAGQVLVDRAAGMTLLALSAKYGVTLGSIIPLVKGKHWRRVVGPREPQKRQLTQDQRVAIIAKRATGATLKELAKEFNMSVGAIHMLVTEQTWKK